MRSPLAAWLARHPVRVALFVSLALLWLNFGLTTRWAGVDGSINGAKRPFFALALLVATVLSCWRVGAAPVDGPSRRHAQLVAIGGIAVLACAFVSWFPVR